MVAGGGGGRLGLRYGKTPRGLRSGQNTNTEEIAGTDRYLGMQCCCSKAVTFTSTQNCVDGIAAKAQRYCGVLSPTNGRVPSPKELWTRAFPRPRSVLSYGNQKPFRLLLHIPQVLNLVKISCVIEDLSFAVFAIGRIRSSAGDRRAARAGGSSQGEAARCRACRRARPMGCSSPTT
eukprot:SAG22_NODE_784_length_7228_cov_10.581620_4_plen_177_part_00